MESILYFRQKTMEFFTRNEMVLMPAVKFAVMMAVLLMMNWHLGYRYVMMRWILVILVSLISALLPWSGIAALAAAYLVGHVSALTLEGAGVLALFVLGAALLHYLFLPGGSWIVMLLPLAYYLKVPYLLPLVAGVFGSALAFLPVGEGVVLYYLMLCLERNASVFLDPGSTVLGNFLTIVNGMNSAQLYITLAGFCLVTLAVYGISHLHVDYAHLIAVGLGGVLLLLTFLLGGFVLSLSASYVTIVAGCVVCTLIAALLSCWVEILDYSCTEYLEYEDDEYVYYVKAVPKIRITERDRKVRSIRSQEDEDEE